MMANALETDHIVKYKQTFGGALGKTHITFLERVVFGMIATLSTLLRWLGLGLIQIYRYGISPLLPAHCRYAPSCSEYALTAFRKHTPWRAVWLSARRITRCHPWGGHGYDPVPGLESGCSATVKHTSSVNTEPPASAPRQHG